MFPSVQAPFWPGRRLSRYLCPRLRHPSRRFPRPRLVERPRLRQSRTRHPVHQRQRRSHHPHLPSQPEPRQRPRPLLPGPTSTTCPSSSMALATSRAAKTTATTASGRFATLGLRSPAGFRACGRREPGEAKSATRAKTDALIPVSYERVECGEMTLDRLRNLNPAAVNRQRLQRGFSRPRYARPIALDLLRWHD
jgi:hypothetical protein